MSAITKEYLVNTYVIQELSTYEIAIHCNTYPNRIRRLLIKFGIPLRDKSSAQSAALKSGRHKHPTRGQHRPEHTRIKISEGVAKAWESMSETNIQKRVLQAKVQWNAMSEEERERFRKLAAEAVRKAAENGSKLEQYLLIELKRREYTVIFHKSNMISNEQLQVDLYLPDLRTAIEIDGPSHFLPIWGEDNLKKHLTRDHVKTGLLLNDGYVVIRIKNMTKNISNIKYRHVLTKLLETLECIRVKFPEPPNRFIEIQLTGDMHD